jgi:hypothetical protein
MPAGADQHATAQTAIQDVVQKMPAADVTDHQVWIDFQTFVKGVEAQLRNLSQTATASHVAHKDHTDHAKAQAAKHSDAASTAASGSNDAAKQSTAASHTAATHHVTAAEDHLKAAEKNVSSAAAALQMITDLLSALDELLRVTENVPSDAPDDVKAQARAGIADHHAKVNVMASGAKQHVDDMADTARSLDAPEDVYKDDEDAATTMKDPEPPPDDGSQ